MTATAPTRTACIFCGSKDRKLTKEHAWPRWLADVFPELRSTTNYRHPGPSGQLESWVGPSFEATVRVVCVECNSTWMSAIEVAAKKLASKMVRPDQPIVVDSYAQAELATWAFLRGVILQYTGAEQFFVPDVDLKEFFRRRRPPMQSRIWMAAYSRPFALTTYRASGGGWNPPETGEFYVLTLSVGVLAFHIFGHTSPTPYDHDFRGSHPGLVKIWPAAGLVTWPPPVGFDDSGIEQLHTSLPANWSEEARAIREQAIADRIRNRGRD